MNYILQYFNNVGENNTQECVICLEKKNNKNKLQHIDKYMHNRMCECNYYIHDNCFHDWKLSHYYNGNNNEMKCLICNSPGNISVREHKTHIGFFEMALLFLYFNI